MRYFFNLYNDIHSEDEEGIELPDEAAAYNRAKKEARAMAAESVQQGRLDLSHFVEVTDNSAAPLLRVTFGDVVTVTS